eukprot:gene14162-4156_t
MAPKKASAKKAAPKKTAKKPDPKAVPAADAGLSKDGLIPLPKPVKPEERPAVSSETERIQVLLDSSESETSEDSSSLEMYESDYELKKELKKSAKKEKKAEKKRKKQLKKEKKRLKKLKKEEEKKRPLGEDVEVGHPKKVYKQDTETLEQKQKEEFASTEEFVKSVEEHHGGMGGDMAAHLHGKSLWIGPSEIACTAAGRPIDEARVVKLAEDITGKMGWSPTSYVTVIEATPALWTWIDHKGKYLVIDGAHRTRASIRADTLIKCVLLKESTPIDKLEVYSRLLNTVNEIAEG